MYIKFQDAFDTYAHPILYYGVHCQETLIIKSALDFGKGNKSFKPNEGMTYIYDGEAEVCNDSRKEHYLFLSLPEGYSRFKENNYNYVVYLEQVNPVVATSVSSGHHYQIHLWTDADLVEVKEFLIRARKYYYETVLSRDSNAGQLTCYLFSEDYWEYLGQSPKRNLDTLFLPKKLIDGVVEDLKYFLTPEAEADYLRFGKLYKRIYLFEGPPGTGKTSLIRSLASMIDHDVSVISFGPKVTDGILMSAIRKMRNKSILCLEDIDTLFEARKKGDDQRNMITFSGLLNTLDGILSAHGMIVFMTTNYKDRLDSALIRAGRVDYICKFDYIKKSELKKMFTTYFPDQNFESFYKAYRDLGISKVPAAVLQSFFFINRKEENIVDVIENLKDIHELHKNKRDEMPMHMST